MSEQTQLRAFTALLSAATLLSRVVDQDLRDRAGITHAQFEILARLSDGGIRMTDLARGLILSRSGATYRIQQLVAAGYVARADDPSDDRGVIASLTQAGHDVLAAATPGHRDLVQEVMFDVLTDSQLETMSAALEAVIAQIEPSPHPSR
ncbi:MarR family winged helix-turn-helix transcriptional regulator [Cellulomonas sp. McL0617]|uniref:MarR family winged helix-turn-helix transcriptional regulator n=1 Tax=Cellulomonas sp. McL0617 TaxID=3415675 RepID=UPI003CF8E059